MLRFSILFEQYNLRSSLLPLLRKKDESCIWGTLTADDFTVAHCCCLHSRQFASKTFCNKVIVVLPALLSSQPDFYSFHLADCKILLWQFWQKTLA